jgi:hypothetical protein
MPLIIPTQTLEKLKKFPTQIFISVLLILVGYFINVTIRSKDNSADDWKERALKAEKQKDSVMVVLSNMRDTVIKKEQNLEFYHKSSIKIDSITHAIIKPKAKKAVKLK